MSQIKNNTFSQFIRELIEKELDEASTTATTGGEYQTPLAFRGNKFKAGKKKKKAGYARGHKNPTVSTTYEEPDDPKLRKEGKYHDFRNDDTMTPKQKIGMAMRETRDSLDELEKIVKNNVRLKNELNVDSRSYWKNTHKALSKIGERLVNLANKVGQLH